MSGKQFVVVLKDNNPLVPDAYLSEKDIHNQVYSEFVSDAFWKSDLNQAVIFINPADALFACAKISGNENSINSFLTFVPGAENFLTTAANELSSNQNVSDKYLAVTMIHDGQMPCWETLLNKFKLNRKQHESGTIKEAHQEHRSTHS